MPARSPLWQAVRITPVFRQKVEREGGNQYEFVDGGGIQAEKFEARGGITIGSGGGDGTLETRVRFKVRQIALGSRKPHRIREASGEVWEVDSISTPSPDMHGNRGARGIVFIEAIRVGGNT